MKGLSEIRLSCLPISVAPMADSNIAPSTDRYKQGISEGALHHMRAPVSAGANGQEQVAQGYLDTHCPCKGNCTFDCTHVLQMPHPSMGTPAVEPCRNPVTGM